MKKEQIIKKQLAILKDTAEYYNISKLAINKEHGVCTYYDKKTQNKCAIGRLVSHMMCLKLIKDDIGPIHRTMLHYLPKELTVLGENYLEKLQSLHDKEKNWTKIGLSRIGKMEYDQFKTQIIEGLYVE